MFTNEITCNLGYYRTCDNESATNSLIKCYLLTPATPMSDQERIFAYNINAISNQISDENKEKYQFEDK